ncbi:unnamed protein product [Fusarium graminearum]|uniref:Chromosome 1, complete genome n=2 Tax=Gibberella zeae (strain ATCC MYA-4620 / CBS 123657 / FGSC 9075 / NRRL 31084 / PH-1) TaxID=229533 RepID=A0A098D4N8_GIBZE|nr:unnamed protein product [Fusarium graminearum]
MLPGCPADEVLQATAPIPRNGAPDLWTLISNCDLDPKLHILPLFPQQLHQRQASKQVLQYDRKKVYFIAHAGPNPVVSRMMSVPVLVGPCKSSLCPRVSPCSCSTPEDDQQARGERSSTRSRSMGMAWLPTWAFIERLWRGGKKRFSPPLLAQARLLSQSPIPSMTGEPLLAANATHERG